MIKRLKLSDRATRDGLIVCVLFAVFFLAGATFDLLEHLLSFTEKFEEYELDELIFASFSAFPLLLWFGVRRTREARRELSASKSLYEDLKIGISHDPAAPFPLATLEDAGMAVALDGKILRINQSAVALFGYSATEATGRRVTDLIYVEGSAKEATYALSQMAGRRQTHRMTTKRRRKDGSIMDVDVTIFPTHDGAGAHTGSWVFYRDISNEVEQDRLINLYRQVWLNADVSVGLSNDQGKMIDCTPASEKMFGLTREQMIGQSAARLVDIMDSEDKSQEMIASIRESGSWIGDFSFRHPDGSIRHAEQRVVTLKNPDSSRAGGASITIDITERKNLEESLRQSEETLRSIIQYAQVGIVVASPEGKYLQVNPSFCDFLGRSEEEILGHSYRDFSPPDEGEQLDKRRIAIVEGDATKASVERSYFKKDGTVIWGNMAPAAIRDESGKVTSFVTVTTDMTARHQAEARLRESEERLQQIIAASDAGLWDLDAQTGRVVFNDYLKALSGYGAAFPNQIEAWRDLIDPEDRAAVDRIYESWAYNSASFDITYRIHPANGGDMRWVRSRGRLYRNEEGVIARGFGLIWDVTDEVAATSEKKELEGQLAQAQKMEAVGKLTGGVAHDFNNLLTIIIGCLQLLSMAKDDEAMAEKAVERAMTACDRAASLTKRLLAFSRKQPLTPQLEDIRGVVENVQALMVSALNETIDLKVDMPEQPITCFVDAQQLEQVLVNLLINARDAMPDGGSISVSLDYDVINADDIALGLEITTGPCAIIRVVDDGTGMSPEVLQRAIDPFFTTKKVGQGSGLGLSMAYGFLKQSGGDMKIESTPGNGAAITLYLPIKDGNPVSHEKRNLIIAEPAERKVTVLLVEDEEGVRETTKLLLEARGFTVVEAANGPAALRVLESGPSIDILFSDVVMPGGMTGTVLAANAYRLFPKLPVILTSGYADDEILNDASVPESVQVLAKPYDPQALVALFDQIIKDVD